MKIPHIFILVLSIAGLLFICSPAQAQSEPRVTVRVASPMCETNAQCDDGLYCNGAEICRPDSSMASRSGCVRVPAPVCAFGCDESRKVCSEPDCADRDGDGQKDSACDGRDCDDRDASRFLGNAEVCDIRGKDEDCDPSTFGNRDQDRDGYVDNMCFNLIPKR